MTNLEHLQLAKKQDNDFIELAKKEKGFFEKHGYGMYDYPNKDKEKKLELMPAEYRKIKALEIIAEELCIYNKIHTYTTLKAKILLSGKTYWDWKKEEDEKKKK